VRATAKSVVNDRSIDTLSNWWLDWPCRHFRFWRELLFEQGQGWLRWGTDERTSYEYLGEGLNAPEEFPVAPPLRRFARGWRYIAFQLRCVLFNFEGLRHDYWPLESPWTYAEMWRDPDRKRNLWGW
jgi:hypothetical protein